MAEPVVGPTTDDAVRGPEHELLLRAALWVGADAVDAWRMWSAITTVDTLDPDSQWLLPLLFHNLQAQGVPSHLLVRYRHVYRHNWYKNQLRLRRAEAVIDSIEREQGASLILGGAAMALRCHDAIGVRPFESVQVLVRSGVCPHPDPTTDGAFAIDVRRWVFGGEHDEAAMARATEESWRGRRWRVLDSVDQLLDICLRRHEWDRRSKLFWIADAVTLVRRQRAIDWTVVDERATQIGLREHVASALRSITPLCAGAVLPHEWSSAGRLAS